MPRPRAAMRKVREVLRLVLGERLSRRQVGAAVGLPYTTVTDYVDRARRVGLGWPLPDGLDDRDLEARLFPSVAASLTTRPQPEWAEVHRELHSKGVTLQLLWMEHKERCPEGYQYTQFVHHYRRWARQLDVVLRHEHHAGEKLFVDFAGQTLPIVDAATGTILQAQLFVAVLGASNYTYAEATLSQELPHWVGAHVHAFAYFGAVPEIVVPDNLKAGVTRAHRYEPDVNATYAEMAAHYGCAVIPTRSHKPRDKAKVEAGVLIAERWILASLRNVTFFSLVTANDAIRERLEWLNNRRFQKLEGTRRTLFEELDRPAMRPLPARPYEYAVWKQATVSIDYHVEVERHCYSVPYQLVGQRCDVRLSATVVEVLHRGRRVASHARSYRRGYTTDPAHMPASHRRHLEWTPGRIVRWAEQTGPATAQVVAQVLASRPHPEQGFRSCLGILRLSRRFGAERLEAACRRAVAIQAFSYRSVESILKTGLDRQPLPAPPAVLPLRRHENVRGPAYYH